MLVLTRTVGEEVVIGGGITVRVLSMTGRRIRLGIEAPEAVPVHRREVSWPEAGLDTRAGAAGRARLPRH